MAAPIVGILASLIGNSSSNKGNNSSGSPVASGGGLTGIGGASTAPVETIFNIKRDRDMRDEASRQFDESLNLQRELAKMAMAQDNYNASRNRQSQGFDALAGLRQGAYNNYRFSR